MVNDILRDMDIDAATRDAHGEPCIECQAEGCQGCPAGSAGELPILVRHEREVMHEGCIPAFDALIENRDASDGVPVLLADDDLEETTPVEPLTNDEIAKLDPLGVFTKEVA